MASKRVIVGMITDFSTCLSEGIYKVGSANENNVCVHTPICMVQDFL